MEKSLLNEQVKSQFEINNEGGKCKMSKTLTKAN